MTDIHLHDVRVVHIHLDQSRMDAAAVARQVQTLLAGRRRVDFGDDDEGEGGQPAVKP